MTIIGFISVATLSSRIDSHQLSREEYSSGLLIFIIFYGALLIGSYTFLLLHMFKKNVTVRVRGLEESVSKVMDCNFDEKFILKGNDEITSLTRSFKNMLNEIKRNDYLNKNSIRDFSHKMKSKLRL